EYGGKLGGNLRDAGFNITSDVNWGYPSMNFVNLGGFFPSAPTFSTGFHYFTPTRLWTLKDDFAFSTGAHSLKMGFAVRSERDKQRSSPIITFNFSDDNPQGTGNEAANFLLGLPTAYYQSAEMDSAPRRSFEAFYFQDDFRLSSDLTLNLGLRYEI